MAFNDRVPPNGGMSNAPMAPPPGLLSPQGGAPSTPIARPANAPPAGLLSPQGAPSVQQPAPPPRGGPSPGIADRISIPDRQALIFAPPGAQKIVQDTISKNLETTPDMKNSDASGTASPLDYASQLEANKAVAAAKGARVADAIKAGGQDARHTVNTLNTIEDALDHAGNNISTGPGAEFWMKAKQGIQNMFPDTPVAGLPEAEVITKLNARLAAEAAKQMTARPSQLEFKTFMANNPGLLTSPTGTKILINVMRQMTQQDIGLGQKAMTATPNTWGDTEDKFYQDNPIKSPFTGKPLAGAETVPGLGPKPTHFGTGSDGVRRGLINGQLVPVDKNGAPLPVVGQSQ
jgi:hypothetical protein